MKKVVGTLRTWGWWRIIGVVFVGLLVAMALVVGGAAGLAWTSTEKFCISCHEMRENVYAEYQGTIHDTNRSGVRAICTDCHVPHEPVPLIKRKFAATLELYHAMVGTIDTKEKFEARRYTMALHVWQRMKDTDSLECRNCHHRDAMSSDLQTERAQKRHAKADAEGMTCIDCHFGIAHQEPEGPLGPRDLPVRGKMPSAEAKPVVVPVVEPDADSEADPTTPSSDDVGSGAD